MGVVRREGEWRLEKVEDGHYELTHRREVQSKILTPDYDPGVMGGPGLGFHTVHEVDSYAEAEGIFEEHARGGTAERSSPMASFSATGSSGGGDGFDLGIESAERSGSSRGTGEMLEEAEDLPPGGIAMVLVLSGGIFMWVYGFAPGELPFQFAALMTVAGMLIFAWAAVLFQQNGWRSAFDFLATLDDEKRSHDSDGQEDSSKTTAPVPEQRKRELIFDRAEQRCEWCETDLDNPQIHHIKPRSEGGSNEPSNLMILCPTCHSKADNGNPTRTKLRQKLRHNRD